MKQLSTIFIAFVILLSLTFCQASNKAFLQPVSDGVVTDVRTGKMWQLGKSPLFRGAEYAEEYAATLELGGYDDWRLPTHEEQLELYALYDHRKGENVDVKFRSKYWVVKDAEVVVGSYDLEGVCADSERVFYFKTRGYVRAIRP